MRCLSPHSNYSIQVIEGEEMIVTTGQGGIAKTVTTKKPVIADFQQRGLLDHEIEVALENFNFSGLPDGVNPLTRIGTFDSEAYVERFEDDDEREAMLEKIDKRLRKLQGDFPSEFVIVDQPAADKPWPSYDDDTGEDVVFLQKRLGIPAEKVRLYELENENRPEVIEAMYRQEDPEGAAILFGPNAEEEIVVTS